MDAEFWKKKRVLVTGHTGFKGSWLCLRLAAKGARIAGLALPPATATNLFEEARVGELLELSVMADIREQAPLLKLAADFSPEIVFHLAAQPFVLESLRDPVVTYSTNVMGTVHVLELLRQIKGIRALVNVTTDKCYLNRESDQPFKESDELGGKDPYSSSKSCAELVTAAYRSAYLSQQAIGLATARGGNVIGGGDWALERLVPDCLRAMEANETIVIRNPRSIRPWQHVLDCLSGYVLLAERLYESPGNFSQAYNFGPGDDGKTVEWIVSELCARVKYAPGFRVDAPAFSPEARLLRLDSSKAAEDLGWRPRWNVDTALQKTLEWALGRRAGTDPRALCDRQLAEHDRDAAAGSA